MDIVLIRVIFVIVVAAVCYFLRPFGLNPVPDVVVGAGIGLAIVLFEMRLRQISLKRLIGAALGSILGIVGAYLFSLVIRNSLKPGATQSFLQLLVILLMAYVGLIVGAVPWFQNPSVVRNE